jgi:NAD-dependent DNA ligase
LTGIERYLGSGMVKGIGPVYAGKLVKAFGAAVFDVIEQSPERLREIPGIGEVRARKITSGWADQKVIRSIMVFLHAHGVSTSRAVRIFKTYGQGPSRSFRKTPTDSPRTFAASAFSRPTRLPRRSASPRILPCEPRPVFPTRSPKPRARATAACPTPNWCLWR